MAQDAVGSGGLWESLQSGWENLLDSLQEKGVPLRDASDWLEAKGIPALPFFLFVLLILVLGAGFFLFGQQVLLEPKNADVLVTLKDFDNTPIGRATIHLTDRDGVHEKKEGTTDSQGRITFKDLPIGTTYKITVFDEDGVTSRQASLDTLRVAKDSNRVALSLSAPIDSGKVSLTVSVVGPPEGPKDATFFLLDENGIPADSKSGSAVSFDVDPNKQYRVSVRAEGYSEESRSVPVGGTDVSYPPIVLRLKDSSTIGILHVGVFDAAGAPLANASVSILDSATGSARLTGLMTSANGGIAVQELPIGSKIIAAASLAGYVSASSDEVIVSDDSVASVTLTKIPEAELKSIRVVVRDFVTNTTIANPVVRLYTSKGARIAEQIPENGSVLFSEVDASRYYVTAYKPGYLPGKLEQAQKGSAYVITLVPSGDANSARVVVSVENQDAESIVQASVELVYADGKPLGIPGKISGPDGTAQFDDVPLLSIIAKAGLNGRDGAYGPVTPTLQGTGEEAGVNLYPVKLTPTKGKVIVTVRDHFSGKKIENAQVLLSPSAIDFLQVGSCATSKQGICTTQLLEGSYVASVSAAGYDNFYSSEFAVKPNADNKADFSLIKSEVAQSTRLVFQGVFDLQGRKVSSLAPSTTYAVKLLLNEPKVKVSKTQVQFRIGGLDAPFEAEVASIVGYDAAGGSVTKGTEYPQSALKPSASATARPPAATSGATTTTVAISSPSSSPTGTISAAGSGSTILSFADPTPTPSPTPSSALTPTPSPNADFGAPLTREEEFISSKLSPLQQTYKYVDFTIPPYQGTKEVSIQIRTKPVSEGKVDLQYRAAFYTDSDVLRDPLDRFASRDALIANMHSTPILLSFGGVCESELCIESSFDGVNGRIGDNYEAQISETFKLRFNLIAPRDTTVELSAERNDDVELRDGSSEASRARITQTQGKQVLTISTDSANAQGEFSIRARRLASDVPLTLTVTGPSGTVSRQLSVRVVGDKPSLKITFLPKTLASLKENNLRFTINDQLGLPVKNAIVTVGNGVDALKGAILEGTLTESKTSKAISYLVDGIQPVSAGSVAYKVDAPGFRTSRGIIPVSVDELISVDKQPLSLAVDSDDFQAASFNIQNLLQNGIKVTLEIVAAGDPQYTGLELEKTSISLKASESKPASLKARLREDLLKIARVQAALKENVQGVIRVTARLGTLLQVEEVPFKVSTVFTQERLDDQWDVSSDSLTFALELPKVNKDLQTIVITNKGSHPLLLNQQSTLRNVFITPLSLSIAPGSSAEIKVNARAPVLASDCLFQDNEQKGNLALFASVQGISSRRSVNLEVLTSSTANCEVKDGIRLSLPMQVTFQMPADSKQKENPDGSTLIQLPTGERFSFEGASVSKNLQQFSPFSQYNPASLAAPRTNQATSKSLFVTVPPGTFFEVPKKYATQTPLAQPFQSSRGLSPFQRSFESGAWQLRFPIPVYLDFDTETEFTKDAGLTIASFQDYDVSFPQSSQFISSAYYGAQAPYILGLEQYNYGNFPTVYSNFGYPYSSGGSLSQQSGGRERRASLQANTPFSVQLTPLISSRDAIEVYFPTETTFLINEAVRVRKDDYTASRALQFRSGLTIIFPEDVKISTDTNDFKRVTIPSLSPIRIPSPYALKDFENNIRLQFPFTVLFKDPAGAKLNVQTDANGFTARSIGTEEVEVLFSPSARLGLALADKSRNLEVQPLAQITIRPTPEYGIYGPQHRIPVGISLLLPASASVIKKTDGNLIIFANGDAMQFQGGTISAQQFDGTRKVQIPINTVVIFTDGLLEKADTDEEDVNAYTITLPVQWTMELPLAGVVQTKTNSILVDGQKLEIVFPYNPQIEKYGAQSISLPAANYQSVNIAPETPITFKDYENQLASIPIVFQGLPFDLPINIQFDNYKGIGYDNFDSRKWRSFKFNECQETKIDFGEDKEFEALSSISFKAAKIGTLDVEEAFSQGGGELSFEIPKDQDFLPFICKDADGNLRMKATFAEQVTYTLPEQAEVSLTKAGADSTTFRARTADLKGCRAIKVQVGGYNFTFPLTESIEFSSARPKDAAALEDKEQEKILFAQANSETTFVLCKNAADKGKAAAGISDSNLLSLVQHPLFGDKVHGAASTPAPASSLKKGERPPILSSIQEFTLDNTNQEAQFTVCAWNEGQSTLKVKLDLKQVPEKENGGYVSTTGSLTGDSIDGLAGVIRKVDVPANYYGNAQLELPPKDRQTCESQSFRFTAQIPAELIDPSDGCVRKSTNKEITGKIHVYGLHGQSKTEVETISVSLRVKDEGECKGSRDKQFREMFQGLYSNYDSSGNSPQLNERSKKPQVLLFKDNTNDHKRTFALANNLDEAVVLKTQAAPDTEDWSKYLICTRTNSEGAQTGAIDGPMARGESIVVTCTPREEPIAKSPLKTSILIKTYSATDPTREEGLDKIDVEIHQLESNQKALYGATPLGDLAPPSQAKASAADETMPATTEGTPATPDSTVTDTTRATTESKAGERSRKGSFAGTGPALQKDASVPVITSLPSRAISFADAETPKKPAEKDEPVDVTEVPVTQRVVFGDSPGSNIMRCQTNFCQAGQVQAAVKDYIGHLEKFVQDTADHYNTQAIADFCARGDNAQNFRKSIIVQAAGTRTSIDSDDLRAYIDEAFKPINSKLGNDKFEFNVVSGKDEIRGCGIYAVEARLNICSTGIQPRAEAWLRSSSIELQVRQLQTCDETLANAGLLLAEEPEVQIGREQNGFGFSFSPDRETIFEKLNLIALGHYKKEVSEHDAASATALHQALFGTSVPIAVGAYAYNDAHYCWAKAGKASLAMLGAEVGLLGTMAVVTGGGAAPFVAKAAASIVSSGAICLSTVATSVIPIGGTNPATSTQLCDSANACVQGQIFSIVDALISPAPGVTSTLGRTIGARFLKETTAYTAMGAGLELTRVGLNAYNDDDAYAISSTTVPALVAGKAGIQSVLRVSRGTDAYVVNRLMKQGKTFAEAENVIRGYANGLSTGAFSATTVSSTDQAIKTAYEDAKGKGFRDRWRNVFTGAKATKWGTLKSAGGALAPILAAALVQVDFKPIRAELDPRYRNHIVVFNSEDEGSLKEICYLDLSGSNPECVNRIESQVYCEDKSLCMSLVQDGELTGVKGYSLLVGANSVGDRLKLFNSMFTSYSAPLAQTPTNVKVTGAALTMEEFLFQNGGGELAVVTPAESIDVEQLAKNLYDVQLEQCNKYVCSTPEFEKALPEIKQLMNKREYQLAYAAMAQALGDQGV